MTWWALEPRDPLMIRDGRPFGLDTEGARSLAFPTPSVIAGTLRSVIGLERGVSDFASMLGVEVAGPLLVEFLAGDGRTLWLPAPRDCALFERQRSGWPRYRLDPIADTDWVASTTRGLRPVGADHLPPSKPADDAPAFWDAATFRRWCEAPGRQDVLAGGLGALEHERRVHVAIDGEKGTGLDGKLFQTDGLRFATRRPTPEPQVDGSEERGPDEWRQFGLAVSCSAPELCSRQITLGGERRLTRMSEDPRTGSAILGWRAPPVRDRARVILLTPALFDEGASPETIADARVISAAVGRPLAISGWDMAWKNAAGKRGGPKPSRRCAPAGSVYWVDLGGGDPEAWARRVHLQPISSKQQDRLDGFGLAAVGVWP